MKVKGDVVKELIDRVKALPFVKEVYLIGPKEGADIGLRVKVDKYKPVYTVELGEAIHEITTASENPEEWVSVYWEWEEEKNN